MKKFGFVDLLFRLRLGVFEYSFYYRLQLFEEYFMKNNVVEVKGAKFNVEKIWFIRFKIQVCFMQDKGQCEFEG